MSVAATKWAWRQVLKPVPKLVLMALADAADDKGVCWPSIATLAAKCNLSTRTIRRGIQYLVARDLLLVEHRHRTDGSCSSNRYRLQLQGGDNVSPPPVSRDRTPGPEGQCPPDVRVIPITTKGTVNESPPLHEMTDSAAASKPVKCGGGDLSDLEYPKDLSAVEWHEAAKKLAGLQVDLAQQLLDELAAGISAGSIRTTPLAYLRGLIKRAQSGQFTPEAGPRIAEQRKRRDRIESAIRSSEAAAGKSLPADLPILDNRLARKIDAIRKRSQGID
ncbi:MAG: helix-turn-helix domain-containing protein [Candidatus Thiodiazotropha sp.]